MIRQTAGRLSLLREGSGEPLVLLHPLALAGELWRPLAGKLAGFEVLAVDLRGHGESGWDGRPFSIEDMADDLAAALVAQLNTVQETHDGRSVRRTVAGRCRRFVKDQLSEIDSTDMKVESVALAGGAAPRTATARVRSVYSGKRRFQTLALRKEGGRWKVAGVG